VCSFSAGIAEFPHDGVSWKGLFEVADRNIRRAKEDGRHRAVSAELPLKNGFKEVLHR
jgi:GGDEF domain-containing protein